MGVKLKIELNTFADLVLVLKDPLKAVRTLMAKQKDFNINLKNIRLLIKNMAIENQIKLINKRDIKSRKKVKYLVL